MPASRRLRNRDDDVLAQLRKWMAQAVVEAREQMRSETRLSLTQLAQQTEHRSIARRARNVLLKHFADGRPEKEKLQCRIQRKSY